VRCPVDFPPNPHFSGLIGATHNAAAHLWEEGETATPGIEKMAETGAKSPLDEDGKWVEQKAVELYPYDAGTDSGSNCTSPDVPTGSPEAIHRIEAEPLLVKGAVPPLGTFTFTRLDD
jgi:hypothetical protein